jgi:hypothetical protein
MKVFCHRPGGIDFGLVRLRHGENDVDDQAWHQSVAKLSSKLKEGWLGGKTPSITIAAGAGAQASLPLEPAREPEPMLARDVITLVEAATEPDQLERLAQDETRKTVLAAIQKRAKQLAEVAA